MKHLISFILILLALSGLAQAETIYRYKNAYQGINIGSSQINEVRDILGRELSIEKTTNGFNYIFNNVIINISPPASPAVNSIIITSDTNYICPNGFKIGTSQASVTQSKKQLWYHHKNFSTDFNLGIVYWYKNTKVTRIVLVDSLVDRIGIK